MRCPPPPIAPPAPPPASNPPDPTATPAPPPTPVASSPPSPPANEEPQPLAPTSHKTHKPRRNTPVSYTTGFIVSNASAELYFAGGESVPLRAPRVSKRHISCLKKQRVVLYTFMNRDDGMSLDIWLAGRMQSARRHRIGSIRTRALASSMVTSAPASMASRCASTHAGDRFMSTRIFIIAREEARLLQGAKPRRTAPPECHPVRGTDTRSRSRRLFDQQPAGRRRCRR